MEQLNRLEDCLSRIEAFATSVMEKVDQVNERLSSVEEAVRSLIQQRAIRDYYTTDEIAQLVGRSEFTVREWCRLGRVRAEKRKSGRGAYPAWVISHQELQRFQKEGLLPLRKGRAG